MKQLRKYLAPYAKECVLAPLFKMLEAIFELLVPLVVAEMIDVGIGKEDPSFLYSRGGILFLLALVGMGWAITAQFFAAKAATGFATGVREALFVHVQSLSFTELDEIGTSTLITRATADINQAQNAVNMFLRLFLRSPFIVFGAMICAFTVDATAALIFVVAIPLLAIVVVAVMYVTMPLFRRVQRSLDGLTLSAGEALSGSRVIRAFRREEKEKADFAEKNDALRRLQIYAGRISGLTNPLTYMIVNLATIAILWVGGVRVNEGSLTQGQVVALVNYMAQILVELVKLANLIVTLTRGIASAGRVAEVLEMESSLGREGAGVPHEEAEVVFSHVNLRYKGSAEDALTDIDFSVIKGETVGLIGGTGSGKSSVVQLIPRFYDASEGRVLVGGADVRTLDPYAHRRRIGIVPQKAVLFEGTIRENIRFGKEDASDEEIWEALTLSQAADFVREKGLDFPVEQGGANLSGGQRQRLTIARALVRRPEILILDDSMSALDMMTDRRLRDAIASLSPRPTIFLVSQRVTTLMSCQRILVLDDGALVGQGTHEELLRQCPLYREIYESQTEQHSTAPSS